MSNGPRIVITDCNLGPTDAETRILLEGLGPGVTVVVADCRTEDDVIEVAQGADALLVQWAPITRRVIESLPDCKVISRYGIGLDMIDLAAATERGIHVDNVPHYCIEEVGTHAAALLLALWRRLPQLDASVRAGQWAAGAVSGDVTRLGGATLGLIGLGRIAALPAAILRAAGATVIAYDPYTATVDGVELVGLDELAERADLISLHCPLTVETKHIVSETFLAKVKPTAVLVNTARGDLIDTAALASALHEGRLAGAGLDVFAVEPLAADDPLRDTPNTILTPHAAWCSVQALPALQVETARNVVLRLG